MRVEAVIKPKDNKEYKPIEYKPKKAKKKTTLVLYNELGKIYTNSKSRIDVRC